MSQPPLESSERASKTSIEPGSTVSVTPAGTTRSPVRDTVPARVVFAFRVPEPPAVKACVSVPDPTPFVTFRSWLPTLSPAGTVAVMLVAVTVPTAHDVPPTVTVAPVKFNPVIVMSVAPSFVPPDGLTEVTTGSPPGGTFTVYAAASVPACASGFVTLTSYVPAAIPDGTFAVSCNAVTNRTSVQRVGFGAVMISTFGM